MRYAASEDLEGVTKANNFAVRNCGSQFALSFTRANSSDYLARLGYANTGWCKWRRSKLFPEDRTDFFREIICGEVGPID
jgi:hypothetical protein